ncbi:MAG: hypothetical protein JSU79_01875 [Dehalococcoidales bacterium]|nr:MAG: hypothetical protein JSU79_01875 [Dehalococcoidales bacterium]
MVIINENSLALTLDSINEAFFFDRPLTPEEKTETAKWLAGRQGKPGSYCGMFAPTEYDLKNGVQVFTGEKITTRGAIKHILGEETCRALLSLSVTDNGVQAALNRATRGMMQRLNERLTPTTGYY